MFVRSMSDIFIIVSYETDNEPYLCHFNSEVFLSSRYRHLFLCFSSISDIKRQKPLRRQRPLRRCPPRQCKTSSSPVIVEATSSRLVPHAQRTYQSAIARHLAENELCLSAYDDNAFTVLCRARSKRHLEILEAVFISTQVPKLCAQKQHVSPLKLLTKLTPTGSE